MVTLSNPQSNETRSSVSLAPGNYYASCIELILSQSDSAIKVEIGDVKILTSDNPSLIATDSLRSCFPAFFIFKNGDIGLYHGMDATIEKVVDLLNREDLLEIRIFKKTLTTNPGKVDAFAQNITKHYQHTPPKGTIPPIVIHTRSKEFNYDLAVCYKTREKEFVILVGESKPAANLEQKTKNSSKKDKIVPYNACLFTPLTTAEQQKIHKQALKSYRQNEIDGDDNAQCIIL